MRTAYNTAIPSVSRQKLASYFPAQKSALPFLIAKQHPRGRRFAVRLGGLMNLYMGDVAGSKEELWELFWKLGSV
jgi:hypothetical protein